MSLSVFSFSTTAEEAATALAGEIKGKNGEKARVLFLAHPSDDHYCMQY
jgi:hypothetical protein